MTLPSVCKSLKYLHLACLVFVLPGLVEQTRGSGPPPNVIVILADDLGWADVACNGGDLVETPHIDELARSGVRFTQAYAPSPVCSPTRAAILTGKAPARLHMTIWSEGVAQGPTDRELLQADSLADLPCTETTLAARLQRAGYLTAMVGKWHLGNADHAPETHGFDVNVGGTHWGAPATFFWPYRGAGRFGAEYRYVPHLEFGQAGEYLTDRLTSEAIRVIDHAQHRPFFLYLAHHAPHTPIEAKAADVEHFTRRLQPGFHHQNAVYAAMIKSLDESVGSIVAHLEARGLDQNTIVVFASDNGGYCGIDRKSGQGVPVTSNHPLRSGKGSCYEGGLRVPLVVRWPGTTAASGVCVEPVILTDLFHTLAKAALGSSPPEVPADGVDLSPLLREPTGRLPREALYFHYPHYYDTTTPVSAIREGDYKLLEYFEDGRVELYNLADDPGETKNLGERDWGKANHLRERLAAWRKAVAAAAPRPNPRASQTSPRG